VYSIKNDLREIELADVDCIKLGVLVPGPCYVVPLSPRRDKSSGCSWGIHRTIILCVVLYGSDTWSLIVKEEHRLRVFENRVLRTLRLQVTGGWRKLHKDEVHNLQSSTSIIRIIKRRTMRWAMRAERIGRR
jgi:hypothetical protein